MDLANLLASRLPVRVNTQRDTAVERGNWPQNLLSLARRTIMIDDRFSFVRPGNETHLL